MTGTPEITSAQRTGSLPTRGSEAFFSSGAVTFAAYMLMLKANQEAMNDMAKLAETTTHARGSIIDTVASSTSAMYEDDATQLTQQSNEQWVSVGTNALQVGVAGYGIKDTWASSKYSSGMDSFSRQVTDYNPASLNATSVGDQALAPTREQVLDDFVRKIKTKGVNYQEVLADGGLDHVIGQGTNGQNITFRDVLDSAHSTSELDEMRKQIGKERDSAVKRNLSDQNKSQNNMSMANAVGQAGGGVGTSIFKQREATAMTKKGADSAAQQYAQAGSQFAQEVNKSQTDQSEQANRNSQQVWQSIHETVQVDTRG